MYYGKTRLDPPSPLFGIAHKENPKNTYQSRNLMFVLDNRMAKGITWTLQPLPLPDGHFNILLEKIPFLPQVLSIKMGYLFHSESKYFRIEFWISNGRSYACLTVLSYLSNLPIFSCVKSPVTLLSIALSLGFLTNCFSMYL